MYCCSFGGERWRGKEGHLTFLPSLKHLAMVKVAIPMCSKVEIRRVLREIRDHYLKKYGPNMEKWRLQGGQQFRHHDARDAFLVKLRDKARGLIPEPLASCSPNFVGALVHVIVSIAMEIVKWLEDHSGYLPRSFDAFGHLQWKCVGIVDREKTVVELLLGGNLDLRSCFLLACIYSRQSEVFAYWGKLTEEDRQQYTAKHYNTSVLNYWVARAPTGFGGSGSLPDRLYNIANVSTFRYFYDFCYARDNWERLAFLVKVIKMHRKNAQVVCACANEIFKLGGLDLSGDDAYSIIICFLNWPLQGLFLDVVDRLMVDLDLGDIKDLLTEIQRIITVRRFEDYNYFKLLKGLSDRVVPMFRCLLREDPKFKPLVTAMDERSVESMTREWLEDIAMKIES